MLSDQRAILIGLARRVTEGGDITNEQLYAASPQPELLTGQERGLWHQLSYWADDDEIREKDSTYALMKRDSLAQFLCNMENPPSVIHLINVKQLFFFASVQAIRFIPIWVLVCSVVLQISNPYLDLGLFLLFGSAVVAALFLRCAHCKYRLFSRFAEFQFNLYFSLFAKTSYQICDNCGHEIK